MSFLGGASERLSFVLNLDANGAVRAFGQVRVSAQRDLGEVENRLDRIGGRMQVGGAAALGFAAVAGRALYSFAQASEEAEAQSRKLDQAMETSAQLAGASRQAFDDQAHALQNLTGADGDAITGLQGLLGTLGRTQDEILTLTPLIVDLATRTGMSMDQAGTLVNRALDGNTTRLERYIGQMSEGETVTAALQRTVGGFAEREAQSLSGQLRILSENLSDVKEGIGAGVVSALNSVVGPTAKWAGHLAEVNPELLSTIGRTAAFGTAAIGAVGALSLVAGTALKARDNLRNMADALHLSETAQGRLTSAAKGLAAVGVAVTIMDIADAATGASQSVGDMADSLSRLSDNELVDAFHNLGDVIDNVRNGTADLVEPTYIATHQFRDLAEASFGTAQRMYEAMEASGAEADVLAAMNQVLEETAAGNRQAAQDQEASTSATLDGAAATAAATEVTNEFVDAITRSSDALFAQTDAVVAWEDAIDRVTESLVENGATLDLNTEQGRANYQVGRDAAVALAELMQRRLDETGSIQAATDAGNLYVEQLKDQLRQAGLTEDEISNYIDTLHLIPAEVNTTIVAHTADAVRDVQALQREIAGVTANSHEVDINIAVHGPKSNKGGGIIDFGGEGPTPGSDLASVISEAVRNGTATGDTLVKALRDEDEALRKWISLLDQIWKQGGILTAQLLGRLDPEDAMAIAVEIAGDRALLSRIEHAAGDLAEDEANLDWLLAHGPDMTKQHGQGAPASAGNEAAASGNRTLPPGPHRAKSSLGGGGALMSGASSGGVDGYGDPRVLALLMDIASTNADVAASVRPSTSVPARPLRGTDARTALAKQRAGMS